MQPTSSAHPKQECRFQGDEDNESTTGQHQHEASSSDRYPSDENAMVQGENPSFDKTLVASNNIDNDDNNDKRIAEEEAGKDKIRGGPKRDQNGGVTEKNEVLEQKPQPFPNKETISSLKQAPLPSSNRQQEPQESLLAAKGKFDGDGRDATTASSGGSKHQAIEEVREASHNGAKHQQEEQRRQHEQPSFTPGMREDKPDFATRKDIVWSCIIVPDKLREDEYNSAKQRHQQHDHQLQPQPDPDLQKRLVYPCVIARDDANPSEVQREYDDHIELTNLCPPVYPSPPQVVHVVPHATTVPREENPVQQEELPPQTPLAIAVAQPSRRVSSQLCVLTAYIATVIVLVGAAVVTVVLLRGTTGKSGEVPIVASPAPSFAASSAPSVETTNNRTMSSPPSFEPKSQNPASTLPPVPSPGALTLPPVLTAPPVPTLTPPPFPISGPSPEPSPAPSWSFRPTASPTTSSRPSLNLNDGCIPGWYYYVVLDGDLWITAIRRVNVTSTLPSETVSRPDCDFRQLAFDHTGAAYGVCNNYLHEPYFFGAIHLTSGVTRELLRYHGAMYVLYNVADDNFYTGGRSLNFLIQREKNRTNGWMYNRYTEHDLFDWTGKRWVGPTMGANRIMYVVLEPGSELHSYNLATGAHSKLGRLRYQMYRLAVDGSSLYGLGGRTKDGTGSNWLFEIHVNDTHMTGITIIKENSTWIDARSWCFLPIKSTLSRFGKPSSKSIKT